MGCADTIILKTLLAYLLKYNNKEYFRLKSNCAAMQAVTRPVYFIVVMLLCYAQSKGQQRYDLSTILRQRDSVMNSRLHNLYPGKRYREVVKENKNRYSVPPKINYTRPVMRILPQYARQLSGNICADTSQRLLFRQDPMGFFNYRLTKTSDGNILMPGYESEYSYVGKKYAHIIKCTQQGDTLWSKRWSGGYQSTGVLDEAFIKVYKAFELADKSILLVGDIPLGGTHLGQTDLLVVRLTASGDLMWEKSFKSKYQDISAVGFTNIVDCQQDANGNMYLCGGIMWYAPGYIYQGTGIGLKMDLSGNIIWSEGYTSEAGLAGLNISGNTVTFFGTSLDPIDNTPFIRATLTDASTGNILRNIKFKPSNLDNYAYPFTPNRVVKLKNGNLILYGAGASDGYDLTIHMETHFGTLEITPDYKVVQSHLYKSSFPDDGPSSSYTVFEDGSIGYMMLKYFTSNFSTTGLYGSITTNGVIRERTRFYSGTAPSGGREPRFISELLQADDGGHIITNNITDTIIGLDYTEFMNLHDNDTLPSCLGRDTVTDMHVENQNYYSMDYDDNDITSNVFTEDPQPFNAVENDSFFITGGCKQISFCDSLKLVTSRDTVCENVPVNIVVRKNKECGAIPLWNYDTTVVSSFTGLNDSTVQVIFNKNWQGYIAASIDGCKLLQDSVKFTVLQAPSGLDLGPDTSICAGNTILLNAKSGYVSYKWQDGSVDSVFTVTQPGTYYVNTTDACGGSFSDTVTVLAHTSTPFSIGNDTSICKNDFITLAAPAGFMHYQWAANKILFDSLQTVNVLPLINTLYKVTVEESMGCFASDSINVTVKNVPDIHLGNDTSLCSNQSLILNAGNGFDTYQWNTGSASPQITVSMKGVYSVQASVSGCSAYDTLQILQVNPLPSFSLGNDTALCPGQVLHYSFNLPQAIYEWSTGSTLSYENISKAGTYSLQVTQAGCSGSDTINVIYNPSPIVNLGNDTTLCEKQTLLLQAFNNNASYTWQDGSTAPTYVVKNEGIFFVTADINNCTASDTITVLYKKLPYFTLGKDTFVCAGAPYVLTPFINTNASLLWQDGSTAASYTIQKEGIYFLTAANECGSYTDSLNITTGICNLLLPSGFTPNGDGINDVFKVKYPFPAKDFHFVMYDRWGEKVFETNDINKGWDGNYKGQPAIQNAYIWVINYVDINNKPQQLKGTVMLLR